MLTLSRLKHDQMRRSLRRPRNQDGRVPASDRSRSGYSDLDPVEVRRSTLPLVDINDHVTLCGGIKAKDQGENGQFLVCRIRGYIDLFAL